MSARVFNPLFISEMRRVLHGGGSIGAAAGAASCAGSADSSAPGPPPPGAERVRKQLFGPVDHEESRRFVKRELSELRRRDSDLYGFDFERERPLEGGRLAWERVAPCAASSQHGGDVVPRPYALRRLPYLSSHAAAPEPQGAQEPASPPPTPPPPTKCLRQTCVSDFMKSRKRPAVVAADPKPAADESSAAKRTRKSNS